MASTTSVGSLNSLQRRQESTHGCSCSGGGARGGWRARKRLSRLACWCEKLAASRDQASGALPQDADKRLEAIERRLDEQEQSLRHVLTMMIDYFESQATRAAA